MRIWAKNISLSTRTFYSSLVFHTTPQSRFDRPSLHPIDSSVQPLVNILIIRGTDHSQPPLKKILSYPPFSQAFNSSKWNSGVSTAEGGSPYRGLARMGTREACPGVSVGLLGMSLSPFRSSLLLFFPFTRDVWISSCAIVYHLASGRRNSDLTDM